VLDQYTVIVCTRNRPEALKKCLLSLLSKDTKLPPIIVVDNNSDGDLTKSLVTDLSKKFPNLEYVSEPETGLSQARNKGAQISVTPWLIYLDDDAYVPPNYLSVVENIIETRRDIVCFGGPYYASYDYGKPKWLPFDFGNKQWPEYEESNEISRGYLSGGNLAIKRNVLESVDGFPPILGMRGSIIGYGEDDYVQYILQGKGYKLYFFPEMYIHHSVLPHKLKLKWHLKNAFAKGKDQISVPSVTTSILHSLKSLLMIPLFRLPGSIFRLLTDHHYYFHNVILETICPLLYNIGRLYSAFNRKFL
jgi:glucosyl-dolichyl phosphate glucuronosyltransferase